MAGQTIATLLVKIGVEMSGVSKGIKNVQKNIGGLQGKFQKFRQTSALVWGAIGAVAIKGLKDVSKAAIDFESDLAKLGNITGQTISQLSSVGREAQKVGGQFGVSSNEIVQGLTELAKLGYSTADSLKQLPQILKFTAANGTTFSTTVGLMETTLKDFNLGLKDTNKITDIFTSAIARGRLTADDLAASFKKAGNSGAKAGASVANVAAATSILAQKGFSGAEAGTALNAIFGRMTKTAGPAAKAMRDIGVSSTDASGKIKPFSQTLEEVKGKLLTMTDAQKLQFAAAIAGTEHQAKFLALIDGAPGSFDALSQSLEKNAGITNTFFGNIDKTAGQSLKKLESQFNTFSQNMGATLAPAIALVSDALAGLLSWFNNLSPTMQSMISIVAAIVVGLVALGAIVAILTPAIAALGTVFAILTSPITLVIAAVAALVAGIIYLWKTNETFRNVILAIWSAIVAKFKAVVAFFTGIPGFFRNIWSAVTSATTTAWNSIVAKVRGTWETIKGVFASMVSGAVTWGGNLIRAFARGITGAIGSVISAAKRVASSVAKFLKLKSPADAGPLSDSDKWMPNLMNMMTQGIEMGIPKLQMAVGDVAASLDLGAGTGSTTTNNVNVYPRQANMDARGLNRELTRMSWLNGGII